MQSIKAAREALGMTQCELAELLGITQGAIAQWESGQTHPAFYRLVQVAEILGITVDEIASSEQKGG